MPKSDISFLHKLYTFHRNPMHSVTSKTRQALNGLLQLESRRKLQERGCLESLGKRPKEAFAPDYNDLWFLYNLIRVHKPRVVFEFGSGCSSLVIAFALAENRVETKSDSGFLYSMEADPHWAIATKSYMPGYLNGIFEIRNSPLLEIEYDGIPCFRHRDLPEASPDFLYLDGPALTSSRQVAVDPLDLEACFKPGFLMVVDGRWMNVMFLRTHLKRQYSFSRRWISGNSTFKLLP
jgi:hypothetical protein